MSLKFLFSCVFSIETVFVSCCVVAYCATPEYGTKCNWAAVEGWAAALHNKSWHASQIGFIREKADRLISLPPPRSIYLYAFNPGNQLCDALFMMVSLMLLIDFLDVPNCLLHVPDGLLIGSFIVLMRNNMTFKL